MPTPDGVLLSLVGANVAVFFLWRIADPKFMRNNFMVDTSLETLVTIIIFVLCFLLCFDSILQNTS